ncbi:hypothetical protein [Pseudemcibacter aquimaris]|uniref:hypothetical protein n=1 Tax=Pseudemcibacter aquimaris TaxID=2857064 RepID=UPI002010D846|nr:hypothetical protein [Pseudemcibacter aquimaris]MCC3860475.1 hypothetical protein [Pseudemcibacter aquimaris]WDU59300.1 hypothetical protein KW060_03360 [Pseudemcibacter aquimaris]
MILYALILLLGAGISYYAISNYMKTQPEKFNDTFRKVLAIALGAMAFIILIKGNIPVAGVLAVAAALSWQGTLWSYLRSKAGVEQPKPKYDSKMSREEALEILELQGNPTPDDIKAAHHRLMMKIHPDQGGSGYFAAKLNQAKDILLNK